LSRLEGFGRVKVQDYENGDTRQGVEVKLSAPTAGADDRTDDCASEQMMLPCRPKFKFLCFQMTVNTLLSDLCGA
jgi:hypothetical protein